MLNINKVNYKLKYEKFYNFSNQDWNDDRKYYEITNDLATDKEFVNEFKDKINWKYFIHYCNTDWDIIELYVDYYDDITWQMIFEFSIIPPDFINKYYKHIKHPIENFNFSNFTMINYEVIEYLLENHYVNQVPIPQKHTDIMNISQPGIWEVTY